LAWEFVVYHPTTRVLAVLEILQAHGPLSGPELARRLEVNVRTVRRYVTMLQDLGVPIEAEHGRWGAYRLRPGYRLPPLLFSDDEALALTLGLRTAQRLGLAGAALAAESALAKVEQVLPPSVRARVQAVQESVILDLANTATAPQGAVVGILSQATQQCRRVRLVYRSWSGEATTRTVDPYGLVFHGGRWYAVGHCHLRRDLRIFRLDRVMDAELYEDQFARPDHFDSLEHVRRALATVPTTWLVEVLVRTTLAEIQAKVPPAVATLHEIADGVVLRCSVVDLSWAAHLLVGLGCPLVVRQPDELRAELRRLATRVHALAEAGEA
jgi:predicted DNA-binding transcriptional regulator YafY